MIIIVIFLVVMAITMVLSFRPMPAGESEIDPHFPGGRDVDFPSYPFQLFHMASSPPVECMICRRRYQPHHQLIILPRCGHVYHAHCIRSWLAEARFNQSCPLCRRLVNGNGVSSTTETTSSSNPDTFSSTVAIAGSYTSNHSPVVLAYEEQADGEASVASSETTASNQENLFDIETHDPNIEPVEIRSLSLSRLRPLLAEGGSAQPSGAKVPGCLSSCFRFFRAKKHTRKTGSGHESDLVGLGCFSRCMRFISVKKFRAHDGGSGQSDNIARVRFFSCCFKFNKPKKS